MTKFSELDTRNRKDALSLCERILNIVQGTKLLRIEASASLLDEEVTGTIYKFTDGQLDHAQVTTIGLPALGNVGASSVDAVELGDVDTLWHLIMSDRGVVLHLELRPMPILIIERSRYLPGLRIEISSPDCSATKLCKWIAAPVIMGTGEETLGYSFPVNIVISNTTETPNNIVRDLMSQMQAQPEPVPEQPKSSAPASKSTKNDTSDIEKMISDLDAVDMSAPNTTNVQPKQPEAPLVKNPTQVKEMLQKALDDLEDDSTLSEKELHEKYHPTAKKDDDSPSRKLMDKLPVTQELKALSDVIISAVDRSKFKPTYLATKGDTPPAPSTPVVENITSANDEPEETEIDLVFNN